MQTIGRRGQGGSWIVPATAIAAGLLFAATLSSCGDDDEGCAKSFSDVEGIAECNALGDQFDCQNADFSTCNIPDGTGSGTAPTAFATSTTNGLSESQCLSGADNTAQMIATTRAEQTAQTTANAIAAQVAQAPSQQFDCGGFTEQHDYVFETGEVVVDYVPTRCAYEIRNVADASSCAAAAAQFQCQTNTFVPDLGVCTVGRGPTSSNCLVCQANAVDVQQSICTVTVPVDVDVTAVDVTLTACLICDPPKAEPRCRLSGCRDCDGDGFPN